jgi:hypothetical protein
LPYWYTYCAAAGCGTALTVSVMAARTAPRAARRDQFCFARNDITISKSVSPTYQMNTV